MQSKASLLANHFPYRTKPFCMSFSFLHDVYPAVICASHIFELYIYLISFCFAFSILDLSLSPQGRDCVLKTFSSGFILKAGSVCFCFIGIDRADCCTPIPHHAIAATHPPTNLETLPLPSGQDDGQSVQGDAEFFHFTYCLCLFQSGSTILSARLRAPSVLCHQTSTSFCKLHTRRI